MLFQPDVLVFVNSRRELKINPFDPILSERKSNRSNCLSSKFGAARSVCAGGRDGSASGTDPTRSKGWPIVDRKVGTHAKNKEESQNSHFHQDKTAKIKEDEEPDDGVAGQSETRRLQDRSC